MKPSFMTVGDLRKALELLGPGHDDKRVVVWLPGSKINTYNTLFLREGAVMIEGGVAPGSALEGLIMEGL